MALRTLRPPRRDGRSARGGLCSSRLVALDDYHEAQRGARVKVVLLSWMGATQRTVAKFSDAWRAVGAAPRLAVFPAMAAMWFEDMASALARQVLRLLLDDLRRGNDALPVVLACYSGSAKACLSEMALLLQRDPEFASLRSRVAGVCYDSSPVDYTSRHGVRFITEQGTASGIPEVVRWAALGATPALDLVFASTFARQRRRFWRALERGVARGWATMLLYSEDDRIAPATEVLAFRTRLQAAGVTGRPLRAVAFSGCPHIGLMQHAPDEYRRQLRAFVLEAAAWQVRREKIAWDATLREAARSSALFRGKALGDHQQEQPRAHL